MSNQPEAESLHSKEGRKYAPLSLLAAIIISVALTFFATYLWQRETSESLKSDIATLQTGISNRSEIETKRQGDKVIYIPKSGNLTLDLPSAYGVVVRVDGNKGGVRGARFEVGKTINQGIIESHDYQKVLIDIDDNYGTLDEATDAQLRTDANNGDENAITTNTTVSGLPARLITADGADEYIGKVHTYVVATEKYKYVIRANGMQFPAVQEILNVVLNNLTIKGDSDE